MPTTRKSNTNKKKHRKSVSRSVWREKGWNVVTGKLVPGKGRPERTAPLFECIAEKIPYEALATIEQEIETAGGRTDGVYLAHDSIGVARYAGRGQIFARLKAHKRRYPMELCYFSFYTIASKKHEREIETAILRAAGPQLILNTRKVQSDVAKGDVRDYEPGTRFFERQRVRGRRIE